MFWVASMHNEAENRFLLEIIEVDDSGLYIEVTISWFEKLLDDIFESRAIVGVHYNGVRPDIFVHLYLFFKEIGDINSAHYSFSVSIPLYKENKLHRKFLNMKNENNLDKFKVLATSFIFAVNQQLNSLRKIVTGKSSEGEERQFQKIDLHDMLRKFFFEKNVFD